MIDINLKRGKWVIVLLSNNSRLYVSRNIVNTVIEYIVLNSTTIINYCI